MLKCNHLTCCSKGRGVMLNFGKAKCCICWQEGPAIHILILAHCNTINLQIIICQSGMGGSHGTGSWVYPLWWLLISAALSKDATESPLTLKAVTSSLLGNVMFSLRNNAYVMCVLGVGVGWGPSPSLSPLQLSLQRNDSLSLHHREVYNHSLHCCFLFMHIHAVDQKRIGEGWWGHNLQRILIKYSKALLAELRLLSEGDQGMTYRCLPCGGTVELLQVCNTCSLIPSALVV